MFRTLQYVTHLIRLIITRNGVKQRAFRIPFVPLGTVDGIPGALNSVTVEPKERSELLLLSMVRVFFSIFLATCGAQR